MRRAPAVRGDANVGESSVIAFAPAHRPRAKRLQPGRNARLFMVAMTKRPLNDADTDREQSIAPERPEREGNQIGLANIRGRLALIYDLEAKVETQMRRDRFELTMTLPVERRA